MNSRKILLSWVILYLILAAPGNTIVICLSSENHFALESSVNAVCCTDDPVHKSGSSQFQLDVLPICDCPPCIDIPLSIHSHLEPILRSSSLTFQKILIPVSSGSIPLPKWREFPQPFYSGTPSRFSVSLPSSLVALHSVRLLI